MLDGSLELPGMIDEAADDLQFPTLDLDMDIDSLMAMDPDLILPPMNRLLPDSYGRAVDRHLERQVRRPPLIWAFADDDAAYFPAAEGKAMKPGMACSLEIWCLFIGNEVSHASSVPQ